MLFRWLTVGLFVTGIHLFLLSFFESLYNYFLSYLASTFIAMVTSIYLNQKFVLKRGSISFDTFLYLMIGYVLIAFGVSLGYSVLREWGLYSLAAFCVSVLAAAVLQFLLNYNIKFLKRT